MQAMLGGDVFQVLLSLPSTVLQCGAPQTSASQPKTLKASQSSPSAAAKPKPHTHAAAFVHTSCYRTDQVCKQRNVATLHKTMHGCLSKEVRWLSEVKKCCPEGSDLHGHSKTRKERSLRMKGALKLPPLPRYCREAGDVQALWP